MLPYTVARKTPSSQWPHFDSKAIVQEKISRAGLDCAIIRPGYIFIEAIHRRLIKKVSDDTWAIDMILTMDLHEPRIHRGKFSHNIKRSCGIQQAGAGTGHRLVNQRRTSGAFQPNTSILNGSSLSRRVACNVCQKTVVWPEFTVFK